MVEPDAFDRQHADEDPEPGGACCRVCGSTDVYWMSVLSRAEAGWLTDNGTPRAAALGKPKLFNLSGGEHNCRTGASADEFEVVG